MTSISTEYKHWLTEIKQQIRRSQIKAAVKVNAELLRLYWDLGREISERQMDSAWGSGFFDTLSRDLKAEFPDMRGFSPTNIANVFIYFIISRIQFVTKLVTNWIVQFFLFRGAIISKS